MNTNKQIKSFKEYHSLEVQDSNLKVNRKVNSSASALISKGEISGKTNNSIKGNGLVKGCVQTKDTTPRLQVTVEFAAKQLFQILLVDIKRRSVELNSEMGIVPGAICV